MVDGFCNINKSIWYFCPKLPFVTLVWNMDLRDFFSNRSYAYLALLLVLLVGCEKNMTPTGDVIEMIPEILDEDEVIVIPVVVHVIELKEYPVGVSDDKIYSQIKILNEDFRKRNTDWEKTPIEFLERVADVGIEFRLASIDPDGKSTSGITRVSGDVTGWEGRSLDEDFPIDSLSLYFTHRGGRDAWPRDKYLNIWVADLSDRHGNLGLAGYSHFPGADPRVDGVVIDPRVFGSEPPLENGHTLGRTATHEIGHWLNLRHISGTDGSCDDSEEHGDLVGDTPVQGFQYKGSPVHPSLSCQSNDMFMNFMDRVRDENMFMFTQGQKMRMRELFNAGGLRRQLYLNSRR